MQVLCPYPFMTSHFSQCSARSLETLGSFPPSPFFHFFASASILPFFSLFALADAPREARGSNFIRRSFYRPLSSLPLPFPDSGALLPRLVLPKSIHVCPPFRGFLGCFLFFPFFFRFPSLREILFLLFFA